MSTNLPRIYTKATIEVFEVITACIYLKVQRLNYEKRKQNFTKPCAMRFLNSVEVLAFLLTMWINKLE